MLQLTQHAASVLRDARAEQQVPEHFGLRVTARGDDGQGARIQLNFAEQPAEGDQVSERDGVKLFVAAEVADPLSDLAIDVDMQSSAAGLGLTLRDQGEVGD
jgi:iron-sulfur cluster assembly protein